MSASIEHTEFRRNGIPLQYRITESTNSQGRVVPQLHLSWGHDDKYPNKVSFPVDEVSVQTLKAMVANLEIFFDNLRDINALSPD